MRQAAERDPARQARMVEPDLDLPAISRQGRDERSGLVASGERIALRGARERLFRELAVSEHDTQLAARSVARFPEDIGVAQRRALPRHLEPALGAAAVGGLADTAGGGLSDTAGGGWSFTAGGGQFVTPGGVGRSVLGSGGDREQARQHHRERGGASGGGLPTPSHRPP